MRPFKISALSVSVLTLAAGPVFGAATAIVLNEFPSPDDIGPHPDAVLNMRWPGLAEALAGHEMNVVSPDAATPQDLSQSLIRLSADIDPGTPLLIVAHGVVVEDEPSGWLFFGPGAEIFDNQLADNALNANVIADIARQRTAPVVLVVATDPANADVNSIFKDPADLPETLTYAVIDPDFVSNFLDKALLKDGVPLASLTTSLPAKGSIGGALPGEAGFFGAASPDAVSTLAYDNGIWSAFSDINKPSAIEQYLKLQPDGAHFAEAEARLYVLQYNSDGLAAEEEKTLQLTEDQRFQIQDSLDYLGFFSGVIDGNWGDDTREALRSWQLWSRFPATGYVNSEQLAMLKQQVDKQEEQDRQVALDEERQEREYWLATGARGSEQELRAYLSRYPAGTFADIAHQRLDILAETLKAYNVDTNSRGRNLATIAPEASVRPPEIAGGKTADSKQVSDDAKPETGGDRTAPSVQAAQKTRRFEEETAQETDRKSTFIQRLFWQKDYDELEEKVSRKKAAPAEASRETQSVPPPRPAAAPKAQAKPATARESREKPAKVPANSLSDPAKSGQPPAKVIKRTTRSEPPAPAGPVSKFTRRLKGIFSKGATAE